MTKINTQNRASAISFKLAVLLMLVTLIVLAPSAALAEDTTSVESSGETTSLEVPQAESAPET